MGVRRHEEEAPAPDVKGGEDRLREARQPILQTATEKEEEETDEEMNAAAKSALKKRIQTATRLENHICYLKETDKLLQDRLSSGYSVGITVSEHNSGSQGRMVLAASGSDCECFTCAEAAPVLKAMLSAVSKKLASLQKQYNNL